LNQQVVQITLKNHSFIVGVKAGM